MDHPRGMPAIEGLQGLADPGAASGALRDDMTVEHAADIMWTYSSPELYELLVLTRGWPLDRYGEFIASAMIAALLGSGAAPCYDQQAPP